MGDSISSELLWMTEVSATRKDFFGEQSRVNAGKSTDRPTRELEITCTGNMDHSHVFVLPRHQIVFMNEVQQLHRTIIACRKCPRLVRWRELVARNPPRRHRDEKYWARPLPGFGEPDARLLIIGLAPAAHGGNRTGRIFTGDRSGDWLYGALHAAGFANQPDSIHRNDGLKLMDCYITAAVRCAPPDNKPLPSELANCSEYLDRELALLRKIKVVVALGRIGFEAYLAHLRRTKVLSRTTGLSFRHAAHYQLPNGVLLLASYHPSNQNTATGKLTAEMLEAIFRSAKALIQRTSLA